MHIFNVPEDKELLAILGKVTIQHEHLYYILKMMIKSLANLTPQETRDETKYDGASFIRKRIKKLARNKFGESETLLKIEVLLARAGKLTEKRNELTHGLWAQELDGGPCIISADGNPDPMPSTDDLEQLSNEIESLYQEIKMVRFEGFLKRALDKLPS